MKEPNKHYFLDEAGDTTFYGKGRVPIIGHTGVSSSFTLGLLKAKDNLKIIRGGIEALSKQISEDKYFAGDLRLQKRINSPQGFYFHASDDSPEIRHLFFQHIQKLDLSFVAFVARKKYEIFQNKHHGEEAEFYADLLSHLIKDRLNLPQKVIFNIAARGNSTKNKNLNFALEKALSRKQGKSSEPQHPENQIVFNVQTPSIEPILSISDYFCWSVQRVFEMGETRYYDFLGEKVDLVVDLYDFENYEGSKNYYRRNRRLSPQNKIDPQLP